MVQSIPDIPSKFCEICVKTQNPRSCEVRMSLWIEMRQHHRNQSADPRPSH